MSFTLSTSKTNIASCDRKSDGKKLNADSVQKIIERSKKFIDWNYS